MQPVTQEELEQLIKEAKKAGKDVSDLEKAGIPREKKLPPMGERKEIKKTEKGVIVIESTGPAKEEDFK